MLVCFLFYCTQGCGCGQRPAFPAPSVLRGATFLQSPDAKSRRGIADARHCEPTGRANARPMTGSAKQSTYQLAALWIASSLPLLAMTRRLFEN